MVDTKRVHGRRTLRFETLDAAMADAELLAAAEERGSLRAVGNWTLGQALGHLAYWARVPFDGYPPIPKPPWWIRLVMPVMRSYILNKGMPAGVRMRGAPAGTFGTDLMAIDEALPALRAAFQRMNAQAPTLPSTLFGHMSHEDWIKFNLRHAELHLSFFRPS